MSTYTALPLPGGPAGPLLEAEEAPELAGAGDSREFVLSDSAQSSARARAAGLGLKALVLVAAVSAVLAVGTLSQARGSPGSAMRGRQHAAVAKDVAHGAVEMLETGAPRHGAPPCNPFDKSGNPLALNPCKAPVDSVGSPGSMGEIKQQLGPDVAELISGLKVSESVEASPWRVVAPGWVNVFSEKNDVAEAISHEPHCSIVDGVREGGWLKLTNNRGYMPILHDGDVLLEANKTIYTRITNGTCADNFLFPILSEKECEAAARRVQLFDTSVNEDLAGSPPALPGSKPVPPGCYVSTLGQLRLTPSDPGQSFGQIAEAWRDYLAQPVGSQVFEVICSSQDEAMDTCNPFLNTTSTTTITVSTTVTASTTVLFNVTRPPAWLPTLFCISVTRAEGYEPGLVITQYAKGASIFGCDEFKVYSNGGVVTFGDFDSEPIKAPMSEMGDTTKPGVTTSSFLNTMIFMNVWKAVIKEQRFYHYDWVVKVDPDAVFFPERLRNHVVKWTPADFTKGRSMYFANCDMTYGVADTMPFGKIFGALEIYSRNALAAYAMFGESQCKQMHWQGWGEDFYMQKCMELLEVTHVGDFTLVSDKRCHPAACTDQTKVAFHDFKDIPSYFDCWGQSLGPQGVASYLEKAQKQVQKQ